MQISYQQQLICIYLWNESQSFAKKKLPTKPSRLMGLLMTNELASFRLWTMIYRSGGEDPRGGHQPRANHPWKSSLLIRGDDNDKLKHDKRLIIIWGHHEVWPQEEVPQSEQEPGCWSKTESGCGRYIPVFSDASSNISSQPYNQVLCNLLCSTDFTVQTSSANFNTRFCFFGSLSLCSRQSEDEDRLFGALIENCAWVWRFEAHNSFLPTLCNALHG